MEKTDNSIADVDKNYNDEADSLPNNESDTTPADDSTSDSTDKSEEDGVSSIISMDSVYACGAFSGGTAWVCTVGHCYLVDTTGKALLHVEDYSVGAPEFENGYCHFVSNSKRILTIDTSGNITADFTLSENEKIVLTNGGYVFTSEYVADFDSREFVYRIYGPDGNIVKRFSSGLYQYLRYTKRFDGSVNTSERDYDFYGLYCSYVGNDCIRFSGLGYGNADDEVFHFINDDETVYVDEYRYDFYNLQNEQEVKFVNGYAYVGYANVSKDDFRTRLVFIKESGEVILVTLPFEDSVKLSDISEGYCAFLDEDKNQIVTIDLENATYNYITTEFDDKLEYRPEMCHKNIVIPMTGKDGESYYAVVDINGQTIRSPQKGHYNTQSCVYNEDATPIFDLEEKGFPEGCSIIKHSDGIVLVIKSGWTKGYARYADEKGNILFDSIDTSNAKVYNMK